MTTRRTFLQGCATTLGVALASTSMGGLAATLSTPGRDSGTPLFGVVYDSSHPASTRFGAVSRRLGHRVHPIAGDVTEFWVEHLAAHWRKQPTAIGGMTHGDSLFVLERLGWDHGLRVVFRAEHVLADGRSTHSLTGPESMLASCEALANRGHDYADSMAATIGHCPGTARSPAHRTLHLANHHHSPTTRPLYTWVIAPQQRTV